MIGVREFAVALNREQRLFKLSRKIDRGAPVPIAQPTELDSVLAEIADQLFQQPEKLEDYQGLRWHEIIKSSELIISPAQSAALKRMQAVCWHTSIEYNSVPILQRCMVMLSLLWAKKLIRDPDLITDSEADFTLLYNQVKAMMQVVDSHSGEAMRQYCFSLYHLLAGAACQAFSENLFETTFERACDLEKDFKAKRRENLKKVAQKYREEQRRTDCSHQVNVIVRETIGEGKLPIVMLEFLENYAAVILEKLYLEEGTKSKEWKNTIRDIRYVVWGFKTEVDKEYRLIFQTKVLAPLRRLLEQVEPLVSLSERMYRDFQAIELLLIDRNKGVFNKLETIYNAVSLDSSDLFKKKYNTRWRRSYQPNNYFVYYDGKHEIRCNPLSKEINERYLIFVNQSGEEIVGIDTQASNFDPVNINAVEYLLFDRELLIQSICRDVIYADYQKELKQQEGQLEELDIRVREEEQVENERREKERKEYQRKKQEIKRKRLERIKFLKNLHNEKAIEASKEEKQRHLFAEQLAKLKPSAEINWNFSSLGAVTMELILITETTNRYIFSDRQGRHHLSGTADELIDKLIGKEISIVSLGKEQTVHQTLSDIVALQRQRAASSSNN